MEGVQSQIKTSFPQEYIATVIRGLSFLILVLFGAMAQANIIQLSTSKFGGQYGYLRYQMGQETPDPAHVDAVKVLRELEAKFPEKITLRSGVTHEAKDVGAARIGELYWRSVDVLAYSSVDIAMLRTLPTRIGKPIGGHLPIKDAVDVVERALTLSAKTWDAGWDKRRLEIKSQQQVWESVYGGRSDRDLRAIAAKLGLSKIPEKVEIVMLPYAGSQEGMTLQTMDGWKVIIGSQTHQSSAFAEVVLHEATHVMDLISGQESALARLRKILAEAKRPALEIEQVPHLLIFFAAAAQIRSREAAHRPVGEVMGAYNRVDKKLLDAAKAGFEKLPDEAAAARAIIERLG